MTPTPDQLSAAREFVRGIHGGWVVPCHKPLEEALVADLAALLAAREREAWEAGARDMRKRCRVVAMTKAIDRCFSHQQSQQGACGHDIRDMIADLPIRTLEPPSEEEEWAEFSHTPIRPTWDKLASTTRMIPNAPK